MPQGLILRDEIGNVTLNVTDRITRILGQVQTGTGGGSHVDPGLATGTPWWWLSGERNNNEPMPYVTITGNTIQWAVPPAPNQQPSHMDVVLIYGVY